MEKVYEGKAKIVFRTEDSDKYILHFKDSATAFNAQKKADFTGKGALNNTISSLIFQLLNKSSIRTHFIDRISDNRMLVWKTQRIDIEVVVRNVSAGSICKRLGLKEGIHFNKPIVEFFYKKDELNDPLICYEHILLLDLITPQDIHTIREMALRTNEVLKKFFGEHGLILVDFKLEFGKLDSGDVVIIDEISPDTCRLWDKKTGEKLDKDRFRFDLGDLLEGYMKVLKAISPSNQENPNP